MPTSSSSHFHNPELFSSTLITIYPNYSYFAHIQSMFSYSKTHTFVSQSIDIPGTISYCFRVLFYYSKATFSLSPFPFYCSITIVSFSIVPHEYSYSCLHSDSVHWPLSWGYSSVSIFTVPLPKFYSHTPQFSGWDPDPSFWLIRFPFGVGIYFVRWWWLSWMSPFSPFPFCMWGSSPTIVWIGSCSRITFPYSYFCFQVD